MTNGKELYNEDYDYSDLEDSTKWAYAIFDNNGTDEYYVWIPRFAYNTSDETEMVFIRGNSKITTEGTYLDEKLTVPEIFGSSTGVWKEVDGLNLSGINIFDILDL